MEAASTRLLGGAGAGPGQGALGRRDAGAAVGKIIRLRAGKPGRERGRLPPGAAERRSLVGRRDMARGPRVGGGGPARHVHHAQLSLGGGDCGSMEPMAAGLRGTIEANLRGFTRISSAESLKPAAVAIVVMVGSGTPSV